MGILTPASESLAGTGAVFKYSNNEGPLYQGQTPGSTLPSILCPSKALRGMKVTFSKPQV